MKKINSPKSLVALAMAMAFLSSAHAQNSGPDEATQRLDNIESTVQALEKQVNALSTFLRAVIPSPIERIQPVEISLSQETTKGSSAATLAIIEFSDFQCPFCGQHAHTAYPELQRQLIARGAVQYAFRNLPLQNLHPNAQKAAEDAAREEEQKAEEARRAEEERKKAEEERKAREAQVSVTLPPIQPKSKKTQAGKTFLKRVVFGKMVAMPAEVRADMIAYAEPAPLPPGEPDRTHKVIYCAAAKR